VSQDDLQLWQTLGTWAAFFAAVLTALLAWRIGKRQNKLNEQFGKIQDSVELYATCGQKVDASGDPVGPPFLHIQNVGTRHIYFDRYIFNGRTYLLNGQVRPSTYSNADSNFYWIELPTNGETHVSVIVEYHDIDERKWKSEILADFVNATWLAETFPRQTNE
jgi:hypothetical protein